VDWRAFGLWLRPYAGLVALFGIGAALLAIAVTRAVHRSPRQSRRAAQALSWWVVAAAGVIVAGVAWGATVWLLGEANHAQDPAAARVEAIKTGLSIGAGTVGVFALLLAVRRQWHQELSAAATEHDASERRVTELYTKAVEQLGSDKAAVRLGGLYALERVAQNNPEQQQTVVNVLCAYLRMPFSPPGTSPRRLGIRRPTRPPRPHHNPTQSTANTTSASTAREELEVRLAAQRILAKHLQPGPQPTKPVDDFWKDINVDLTNATLVDWDLRGCRVHNATFSLAQFSGTTRFHGAQFTGPAWFNEAQFTGPAAFDKAQFTDDAWFNEAQFTDMAWFDDAQFTGPAWFNEAQFTGPAAFDGAQFTDDARFDKAQFTGHASFNETQFTGMASFDDAQFTRAARFDDAQFTGMAWFDKAQFTGIASFDKAQFTGIASFDKAQFAGIASFDETRFRHGTPTELAAPLQQDTPDGADASKAPESAT